MKNYEISGITLISNIHNRLKVERINRAISKISPYILIGIFFLTLWLCMQVVATVTLLTHPFIPV